MKITKEEFENLFSDGISKRDYDYIISKINIRFSEILDKMIINRNPLSWQDYGNCTYNDEESNGHFDPHEYKEYIQVGGHYTYLPEPYKSNFDNSFPTRWLWEDFEKELEKEIEIHKQNKFAKKMKDKSRREELKIKKIEFTEIIKSKLTQEELKYIKFK